MTQSPQLDTTQFENHIRQSFSRNGLQVNRCSRILLSQLSRMPNYGGINPPFQFVEREIMHLEGLAETVTKPALPFKKNGRLSGLMHKHFYVPGYEHPSVNVGLAWEFNKPNSKKFTDMALNIAKPYAEVGQTEKEQMQFCGKIADSMIFGPGGLQDRQQLGEATGDWIIFASHEGHNYYLCIAKHGQDDFIAETLKLCASEFPFLNNILTKANIMLDIKTVIRPVYFQNDNEEYLYSTDGGTLFIVNFKGRYYGLTAKHVLKGYDISQLVVSRDWSPQKGTSPAPVDGVAQFSGDGDINDLAIIHFAKDLDPDFFRGTAYVIDDESAGSSDTAHKLKVHGYLKDKTIINYDAKSVIAGYCNLEFTAVCGMAADPFIMSAKATYSDHGFNNLTGISGAPVFDETAKKLCGMVVRGGLDNGAATIWYIDIFHIVKALEGASSGTAKVSYLYHPKA